MTDRDAIKEAVDKAIGSKLDVIVALLKEIRDLLIKMRTV